MSGLREFCQNCDLRHFGLLQSGLSGRRLVLSSRYRRDRMYRELYRGLIIDPMPDTHRSGFKCPLVSSIGQRRKRDLRITWIITIRGTVALFACELEHQSTMLPIYFVLHNMSDRDTSRTTERKYSMVEVRTNFERVEPKLAQSTCESYHLMSD